MSKNTENTNTESTGTKTSKAAKKRSRGKTKNTVTSNVAAVASERNDATDVIGSKVWWDLIAVDGLHVDLHAALKAIDCEDCIVNEPSPVARMGEAMSRVRGKAKVDFKKAGSKNGWTTWSAVKTTRTTDDTATGEHQRTVDPKVVSSIAVNENDGTVSLAKADCEIAAVVVAEYERMKTHFTSLDLSYSIVNVVEKLNGARLRYYGGMYYVPQPDADALVDYTPPWPAAVPVRVLPQIAGIAVFVESLDACSFYIEEVGPTSATARAAGNAAMRSLDGQFNDVLSSVETFVSTMEAGDLVHGRSLTSRVKAAQQLRGRCDLYREILNDRGKSLSTAAEIVSNAMKEIVSASVEVRELRNASGSERAQSLAADMLKEIAEKMRDAVKAARNEHEPQIIDEKN